MPSKILKIEKVEFSKPFQKLFAKLPSKKQQKAKDAINLLEADPSARKLRLHELQGELAGVYSISAGGDLRLHLEFIIEGNVARFVAVGTHSQLYGG